ncbi:MAG TPA: zinc ribbon domain-containing protein [Verrucomicrobiota bacterium]|mgnify:CR=1 FL=1|nr:zinc ribbon domain-containing protein [Verrucomicrobiota bacterium]
MPTYEYECESCGDRFEKRQNMSDPRVKVCPKCGRPVRRLIGAGAGLIFKGSGDSASCSFEQTGSTCCGRNERCDSPAC